MDELDATNLRSGGGRLPELRRHARWESLVDGDEERWLAVCRCGRMRAFLPEQPALDPDDPLRAFLLGVGRPIFPPSPPWIRLFLASVEGPNPVRWRFCHAPCPRCGASASFGLQACPRPSVFAVCTLCLACGLATAQYSKPARGLVEAPAEGASGRPLPRRAAGPECGASTLGEALDAFPAWAEEWLARMRALGATTLTGTAELAVVEPGGPSAAAPCSASSSGTTKTRATRCGTRADHRRAGGAVRGGRAAVRRRAGRVGPVGFRSRIPRAEAQTYRARSLRQGAGPPFAARVRAPCRRRRSHRMRFPGATVLRESVIDLRVRAPTDEDHRNARGSEAARRSAWGSGASGTRRSTDL